MDPRFTAATSRDSERTVAVQIYPVGASIAAVVAGIAAAPLNLTPFANSVQQSPGELTVGLAWHQELYGASQPKAGQVLAVTLDGILLWAGIVESLSDYRLAVGERRMTLVARSRDAFPAWRSVRRVTDIYPMATRLDVIARDVAEAVGLTDAEIGLPPLLYAVPHSNLQLADLAAWDMLESLLLPAGMTPWIDGLGRLRARSRDVTRQADQSLADERIAAVTGARSRPPISSVQVKWLDPLFTEVAQQDQALANANITAGFFQIEQNQDVYWSDDRTQRAKATRLVIKQSANSGLFEVCDEDYRETAHTGGKITLETAAWVPGLLSVFLAMKAAALIPDWVAYAATIPYGRTIQAGIEFSVLLTMSSIGTGVYEVWGIPYDYVHARHTAEAYDPDAPDWLEAVEVVETDLVQDDAHARSIAARELIYRVRSVQSYGVSIVDDPRIEPGDILGLPDGTRLYVTGYRRNLSPGAPALLDVEGFPA